MQIAGWIERQATSALPQATLMKHVSPVTLKGKRRDRIGGSLREWRYLDQRVVEADLSKTDDAGRIMALLIYVRRPRWADEEWATQQLRLADVFLAEHQLALDDELRQGIVEALVGGRAAKLSEPVPAPPRTEVIDERSPDNRSRRVILVLDEGQLSALDVTTQGRHLKRDRGVQIVSTEVPWQELDADLVLRRLEAQGLLQADAVLVQSPFNPDRYSAVESASDDFALEKLRLSVELCAILGATTVTISQIRLDERHATATYTVKGERPGIKGSAEHVREDLDRLVSQVKLDPPLRGGNPTETPCSVPRNVALGRRFGAAKPGPHAAGRKPVDHAANRGIDPAGVRSVADMARPAAVPGLRASAKVETAVRELSRYHFSFEAEFRNDVTDALEASAPSSRSSTRAPWRSV